MTAPSSPTRVPAGVAQRVIPFDYAFQYGLTGERDRVHAKTVTVSTEADFAAVSIGYGVIPVAAPLEFGLTRADVTASERKRWPPRLGDIAVAHLTAALRRAVTAAPGRTVAERRAVHRRLPDFVAAIAGGLRINPKHAPLFLTATANTQLDPSVMETLFQEVPPPAGQFQFKYALFDEGSGRAFQDQPILSTAGLGTADGDRPFRRFAVPITFARQTTIRLEITEISEFRAELHVSLQGFRTLGAPGTPTDARRARRRR